MPGAQPLSFPGGLAYAYTGGNAYAYAYTGHNAYAYSAAEAVGIGGFASDPMLSAAIMATRDALFGQVDLLVLGQGTGLNYDQTGAVTTGTGFGGLPPMDQPKDIVRYGAQVRAAIALFDLSSSVSFVPNPTSGSPILLARTRTPGAAGTVGTAALATLTRPPRSYFLGQLQQVDSLASRRSARAAEIITQVAPPHAYFASLLNLQAGRHRRTMELLNAALQFTYAVTMQFKHSLACPRPGAYTVGVQAMIEVPMHPALPAGHAAEAHVSAAVLGALAGAAPQTKTDLMLRALAYRIAENRIVAGLHFPVDCDAGRLLGDTVASYFLARCGRQMGPNGMPQWTGGAFALADQSQAHGQSNEFRSGVDRFDGIGCTSTSNHDVDKSPILEEMWAEAASEWS